MCPAECEDVAMTELLNKLTCRDLTKIILIGVAIAAVPAQEITLVSLTGLIKEDAVEFVGKYGTLYIWGYDASTGEAFSLYELMEVSTNIIDQNEVGDFTLTVGELGLIDINITTEAGGTRKKTSANNSPVNSNIPTKQLN